MRVLALMLFCWLYGHALSAQFTIAGKLMDKRGGVVDSRVEIRIVCSSSNMVRHSGTFLNGEYSFFLNNVKPSCQCTISADSEIDGIYAEHVIFVSEEYRNKIFNYDVIFRKEFNPKVHIEKLIARMKKENEELKYRVEALKGQVKVSEENRRKLETDINGLSVENENLKYHLESAERTKARVLKDFLPAEEYFDKVSKITEDYSRTRANMEFKMQKLEEKYLRALAINTFASDCKCIGLTDNSIKLSLRLATNEVNDETGGLFIAAGHPLYQKVKVRVQVKALRDENAKEGLELIVTDTGAEYIEKEHFFDENPIEVIFRSHEKAFKDGFLQSKPGRMIEIITPANTISTYLYFPNLKELCKDTEPLRPLPLIGKPQP
jgi:hypothetical protein